MCAIGRNEVHQQLDVLQFAAEIHPADIGLELLFAGYREQLGASEVQRRHAGVTAASDVQRGEIERQAEQVVLQRASNELVDFVADLVDSAKDDVRGHGGIGRRSDGTCHPDGAHTVGEQRRVGEGLDQAVLGHQRLAVGADHRLAVRAEDIEVDVLVEHRMPEAIDDVGELRGDRRIDMHVDAAGQVDGRCDHAGEFVEHDVLVFGLRAELRGLEEALTVPLVGLDDMGGHARGVTPPAAVTPLMTVRSTPGSTQAVAKETSPASRFCWIVVWSCASRRSCSEWNNSWMAVRPTFSFTRPSPAT